MMFEGLMSPWMKPCSCKCLRARVTCLVMLFISSQSVPTGVNMVEEKRSRREAMEGGMEG